MADIQSRYGEYKKIALQIWDYAEVGYKEVKSSALLQKTLTDNGFVVRAGVAEIPTAFVATYGSGSPVIGITNRNWPAIRLDSALLPWATVILVGVTAMPLPLGDRTASAATGRLSPR